MSRVWGVDLSTEATDIAELHHGKLVQAWRIEVPEHRTEAQRQWGAFSAIVRAMQAPAASRDPDVIYVERPTGANFQPHLVAMLGSVCCALGEVIDPGRVNVVAIASWKKKAVGFGNASKDQIRTWAHHTHGVPLDASQDLCDAVGIATMAYLELEEAMRDVAG